MPHPVLFQLNTRVHLNRLARELGKPTTLDDIQDEYLDRLASQGIEWVWLLSVWTTGPKSREESRRSPEWQHEFSNILPDLSQDDIGGSGFAIADYRVSELLGGPKSLARLRERLAKRGIRLMLDFVPNHMGLDHAWMQTHPEYLIQASEEQMQEQIGRAHV